MTAQAHILENGRLHLHHGPIDLICQAWGAPETIKAGYARAISRFEDLLAELVAELPGLRCEKAVLCGPIATVMARAVAPFRPAFITPMAAVAGAVAEAVLARLVLPGTTKAYVNNGGDIALFLSDGAALNCAIAGTEAEVFLHSTNPSRGVATSGWRGRSWSRGIADSVTVLAKTASMADAAATMIANAVDLPGHKGIVRAPAQELQTDSDLGHRLVTTGVPHLSPAEVAFALDKGMVAAWAFQQRGLIDSAAIFLQSDLRTLGATGLKEPALV